jgi:hypothetical protein
MNTKALDAYITAQQEARALLKRLTAHLDAHQAAQPSEVIHWRHVGDVMAIVAQLQAILRAE